MEPSHDTTLRIRTRDAALRLLQRLTVGAAAASTAGVGVFGVVSAATIPGTSSSSTAQAASSTTSSSSSTTAGSLGASSGVSSSSSAGVAVTGGSR